MTFQTFCWAARVPFVGPGANTNHIVASERSHARDRLSDVFDTFGHCSATDIVSPLCDERCCVHRLATWVIIICVVREQTERVKRRCPYHPPRERDCARYKWACGDVVQLSECDCLRSARSQVCLHYFGIVCSDFVVFTDIQCDCSRLWFGKTGCRIAWEFRILLASILP